jgi:hypothetical protein
MYVIYLRSSKVCGKVPDRHLKKFTSLNHLEEGKKSTICKTINYKSNSGSKSVCFLKNCFGIWILILIPFISVSHL